MVAAADDDTTAPLVLTAYSDNETFSLIFRASQSAVPETATDDDCDEQNGDAAPMTTSTTRRQRLERRHQAYCDGADDSAGTSRCRFNTTRKNSAFANLTTWR